jgi:hypothetical protein
VRIAHINWGNATASRPRWLTIRSYSRTPSASVAQGLDIGPQISPPTSAVYPMSWNAVTCVASGPQAVRHQLPS